MTEWSRSGRDDDYLLSGKRLAEYELWRDYTGLRLTTSEREYLDASLQHRDTELAAERARVSREASLARRARHGWVALVGVLAVLGIIGAAIVVAGRGERPTIALLVNGQGGGSAIDAVLLEGFERAAHDFDFEPVVLRPPFTDLDEQLAALAESGADLVFFWSERIFIPYVSEASKKYPDTTWAYIDRLRDVRRARSRVPCRSRCSLDHEDRDRGLRRRDRSSTRPSSSAAGYEAGVHEIDPSIEIHADYASLDGTAFSPDHADLTHDEATRMFRARRRRRDAGRR